jgi:hypothetical protein
MDKAHSKYPHGCASECPEVARADTLWLSPVEIRDRLRNTGFPFENFKANPLASIHTTLRPAVPGELVSRTRKAGPRVVRLKSAGDWAQALAEGRDSIKGSVASRRSGAMIIKRPMAQP